MLPPAREADVISEVLRSPSPVLQRRYREAGPWFDTALADFLRTPSGKIKKQVLRDALKVGSEAC